MPTLYNDIDQHALAWTRELIDLGLISKGHTDGRSISDIQPDDLQLYDRCHFFSGIAGWDYALRLAGWPDGLEVWTGSCPCQSFSTAGKGRGFDDPRGQLWTQFHRLIKARRPRFVFGEQVEGAVRHGWLDLLRADLEAEGYTFRAAVLGAHSSGADHIRQRIYWAGWLAENSISHGRRGRSDEDTTGDDGEVQTQGLGAHGGIPHPRLLRQEIGQQPAAGAVQCGKDGVAVANSYGHSGEINGFIPKESGYENGDRQVFTGSRMSGRAGRNIRNSMADTHRGRLEELRGAEPVAEDFQRRAEEHPAQLRGDSNPWADSTPILCRDGKLRRIPSQSHVQLVVNGLPPGMGAGGDVGRVQIPLGPLVEKGAWQGASKVLKGSGNAIVPQTAAMFIRAIMEETICQP